MAGNGGGLAPLENTSPDGIADAAQLVAGYIGSLQNFEQVKPMEPHSHMGATLTESILQAGLRYETVVLPRVIKVKRRPEARTTSGFISLLEREGANAVLDWRDAEKPKRVMSLASLLQSEGVETEEELRYWLQSEGSEERLKSLKGIGDKTVDYLKLLVGFSTVAVDRHVITFLNTAGVDITIAKYSVARDILSEAAKLMGIEEAVLDHSIWTYIAQGRGKVE